MRSFAHQIWLVAFLVSSSSPASPVETVTVAFKPITVTYLNLKYFDAVMKPDQTLCTFQQDPSIAIFIGFDVWTAQCLKHQRVVNDRKVIALIEYGTLTDRDLALAVQSRTAIDRYGYTVPRTNLNHVAELLDLKVTTKSNGIYEYTLIAQKTFANLGHHQIEIRLNPGEASGVIKTFTSFENGSTSFGQEYQLDCTTKYQTILNNEEVGYKSDFPSKYNMDDIGC